MGLRNRTYRNTNSGEIATAARVLRTDLGPASQLASVSDVDHQHKTGETFRVRAHGLDTHVPNGIWLVKTGKRVEILDHATFAASYVPHIGEPNALAQR